MSSMADLVYALPCELANDLRLRHLGLYAHDPFAAGQAYTPTQGKKRLRPLGNKEILGKY